MSHILGTSGSLENRAGTSPRQGPRHVGSGR